MCVSQRAHLHTKFVDNLWHKISCRRGWGGGGGGVGGGGGSPSHRIDLKCGARVWGERELGTLSISSDYT